MQFLVKNLERLQEIDKDLTAATDQPFDGFREWIKELLVSYIESVKDATEESRRTIRLRFTYLVERLQEVEVAGNDRIEHRKLIDRLFPYCDMPTRDICSFDPSGFTWSPTDLTLFVIPTAEKRANENVKNHVGSILETGFEAQKARTPKPIIRPR